MLLRLDDELRWRDEYTGIALVAKGKWAGVMDTHGYTPAPVGITQAAHGALVHARVLAKKKEGVGAVPQPTWYFVEESSQSGQKRKLDAAVPEYEQLDMSDRLFMTELI